jgi:hypothetical protein
MFPFPVLSVRESREKLRRDMQQQKEQKEQKGEQLVERSGGDSDGVAATAGDALSSDGASDREETAGAAAEATLASETQSESTGAELASSLYDTLFTDDGGALTASADAAEEIFVQIAPHIPVPVGTAEKRKKKRSLGTDSPSSDGKLSSADEKAKSRRKGRAEEDASEEGRTKRLAKHFGKKDGEEDPSEPSVIPVAPPAKLPRNSTFAFVQPSTPPVAAAVGGEADEEDIGEAVQASVEVSSSRELSSRESAVPAPTGAKAGKKVKYGSAAQQSGVRPPGAQI